MSACLCSWSWFSVLTSIYSGCPELLVVMLSSLLIIRISMSCLNYLVFSCNIFWWNSIRSDLAMLNCFSHFDIIAGTEYFWAEYVLRVAAVVCRGFIILRLQKKEELLKTYFSDFIWVDSVNRKTDPYGHSSPEQLLLLFFNLLVAQ